MGIDYRLIGGACRYRQNLVGFADQSCRGDDFSDRADRPLLRAPSWSSPAGFLGLRTQIAPRQMLARQPRTGDNSFVDKSGTSISRGDYMKTDWFVKCLLLAVAISLTAIAL